MDDYIKRKSVYDALCKICNERGACEHTGQEGCHKVFSQIPAADVRENVRGEWECHDYGLDENGQQYYEIACSACHVKLPMLRDIGFDFCPWCGADMRGGGANV